MNLKCGLIARTTPKAREFRECVGPDQKHNSRSQPTGIMIKVGAVNEFIAVSNVKDEPNMEAWSLTTARLNPRHATTLHYARSTSTINNRPK